MASTEPSSAPKRSTLPTTWHKWKKPPSRWLFPFAAINILRTACKPNSVWICIRDGHSSRRAIADALKQPTRRFPPQPPVKVAAGLPLARRAGTHSNLWSRAAVSSLFGLAPCGVYPATGVTAGAVRSYRTFSPLPAPVSRYRRYLLCGTGRIASLDARTPDVIRHTALRSSDFPLPATPARPGSGRPAARSSILPAWLVSVARQATPHRAWHPTSSALRCIPQALSTRTDCHPASDSP
jgi:hypothetical protein